MEPADVLALPAPYYLFRLLTGTDHLHFGWLRDDDEPLGDSQQNMMELNLFFRPRRLQRALDVGTGLGATARWLAARGVAVTAISPDAPLVDYARRAAAAEGLGDRIRFEVVAFESFAAAGPFDWVLFQESFQYFDDPAATLTRARELLRPGGRLHVADQFLRIDVPRAQGRFPFLPRVLEQARAAGFELRTHCDVSRAAFGRRGRIVGELRALAPRVIADHSARRPSIAEDIDRALQWGDREHDAFRAGQLGYDLLVFDRVS